MRASWIAKRFDGKASQYFGQLPRARFAIKPVPDDLAPFYTAGRGGPGLYLVNTYDLPSRPLYNLTALTLHESAPGHAFQMPSHSNTSNSRNSGNTRTYRPTAKAGRCTARCWAWRWACTKRPTIASGC